MVPSPVHHPLLLFPFLLLLLSPTNPTTATATSNPTQTKKLTYTLHHSFGLTGPFHDRGELQVLVDEGALTLIPPDVEKEGPLAVPSAAYADIAREMKESDGGLYRLKALRKETDKHTHTHTPIMTSIHLCDLVRAGFRENITLSLDAEGRLLALEYTPRMSALSPKSCLALEFPPPAPATTSKDKDKAAVTPTFSTLVNIAVDQQGKSVPVVAPGQKPPMIALRVDPEERQPEVQKSFLQKYWIFIVLAYLFLNFSSPPPEEGGAGGGGGGEGEGRRPAAVQGGGGGQPQQRARPQGQGRGGGGGAGPKRD